MLRREFGQEFFFKGIKMSLGARVVGELCVGHLEKWNSFFAGGTGHLRFMNSFFHT